MPVVWRIVREKYAATAFDGEGAYRYGGRWNSQGRRVVYTSATLSLAALEMLVHLQPPVVFRFAAIPVEFDESLVENIDVQALPENWRAEPAGPASTSFGDKWIASGRSPVLSVPSVIIPAERNFLLNPLHGKFTRLRIGTPAPFAFDPRLL